MRTSRGAAAGPALIGIAAIASLAGVLRATEPVLGGPDPFWHWDLGRRIIETGLVREDPYSFLTEGQDWILNQWATEALIGLVDRAFGLPGVAVFGALLVLVVYAVVGWQMWRRSPSLLTVGLFGLVYMAGMSNLSLRGNLFSYLLLAIMLAELRRNGGPRLGIVGGLMVAWTNLHAGFLLGPLLVIVDGLGRLGVAESAERAPLVRRRAVVLFVAVAATLATPYGPGLLFQAVRLSAGGVASGITEWAAPTLTATTVLPYTALMGLALTSVAIASRRGDLPDILLIVTFAIVGASATRNLAPAAVVLGITSAPYVARAWKDLRTLPGTATHPPARHADWAVAGALIVGAVAAVVVLVPHRPGVENHATNVPLAITSELATLDRPVRAHVTSLWAPGVSVLGGHHVETTVDGRLELFTSKDFARAGHIESADPGWLETLNDWCVTDVVVPAEDALARTLADTTGWERRRTAPTTIEGAQPQRLAVWFTRASMGPSCARIATTSTHDAPVREVRAPDLSE